MKQVCFMADIKQMFPQVLVSQEDTEFQRILWRQQESDTLEEYRFLRVTFGVPKRFNCQIFNINWQLKRSNR